MALNALVDLIGHFPNQVILVLYTKKESLCSISLFLETGRVRKRMLAIFSKG